jgi:excisionase family DNA binding protein
MEMEKGLTVDEVASLLPYSKPHIRRLLRQGNLPGYEGQKTLGRKWIVHRAIPEQNAIAVDLVKPLDEHQQDIVLLVRRLWNELNMPPTRYSFIENLGDPGIHVFRPRKNAQQLYVWQVMDDGFTIRLPCALEADKEIEGLYNGLLSHFTTSEFADIVESYEIRCKKAGEYLRLCRELLLDWKANLEREVGETISQVVDPEAHDYDSLVLGLGILGVAVDTARGLPNGEMPEYRESEVVDSPFGFIHQGGITFCQAISKDEQTKLREGNERLREKYAHCELSRQIARLSLELERLESDIRNRLQEFATTVCLPGYCDLCPPTLCPQH